MIKHLTPRSEEEIRDNILSLPCSFEKIQMAKKHNVIISKRELCEYFKNAKDDKSFMKLIEKGKPICNKTFRLKYPVSIDVNVSINNCVFYFYNDAYINISLDKLPQIFNCVFRQF